MPLPLEPPPIPPVIPKERTGATPRSETGSSTPSLDVGDVEPITLKMIEEYLAIEIGMRKSCRNLPLALLLWLAFTMLVFTHGQAWDAFESSQCLEDAIRGISIPRQTL